MSVIIPTYNRASSLAETLTSLSQQTFPFEDFEVIVVDDGSPDETRQVGQESYQYSLHYFRQENQGSAKARNHGAQQARGDLFIFIDDDILLEPEFIQNLFEEHQKEPKIIGMGTEYNLLPSQPTLYARLQASPKPEKAPATSEWVKFTDCVTNNLSVEREAFFEIGLMQDIAGDGPTWWGDVDFGYRANLLGYRFLRCNQAICYHQDYSIQDLSTASHRAYRVAKMAPLLFKKFPEIEGELPMFQDKTPLDWSRDGLRLSLRKNCEKSCFFKFHSEEHGKIRWYS